MVCILLISLCFNRLNIKGILNYRTSSFSLRARAKMQGEIDLELIIVFSIKLTLIGKHYKFVINRKLSGENMENVQLVSQPNFVHDG